MKIPVSDRLLACCEMIRPGDRVADVGTDHGYLGIYLLKKGIASFVIASDINPQPLDSARRNAEKYGVKEQMTFHLSDGVQNIPRDFDCLVCAGMGGDTMIHIFENAPWLRDPRYRLVLQCQSRRPELRCYLNEQGFRILREKLSQDGKFIYPVMEIVYEPGQSLCGAQLHITPMLLESGDPLLPAFYDRVCSGVEITVEGLRHSGGEKFAHYQKLLTELKEMEGRIRGNGS